MGWVATHDVTDVSPWACLGNDRFVAVRAKRGATVRGQGRLDFEARKLAQ